jgi:hypothetical protein
VITTGHWPDNRLFIVFDVITEAGVQRYCWTPTLREQRLVTQILQAVSELSRQPEPATHP